MAWPGQGYCPRNLFGHSYQQQRRPPSSAQERIDTIWEEKEALANRCRVLEDELYTLRKKLEEKDALLRSASTQDSNKALSEAEKCIKRRTDEIYLLREESRKKNDEISCMRIQLKRIQETSTADGEDKKVCRVQALPKPVMSDKECECNELSTDLAAKVSEISYWKNLCSGEMAKVEELSQAVERLKEELDSNAKHDEEQLAEIEELRQKCSDLEKEIDMTPEENDTEEFKKLEAECAMLKKTLNDENVLKGHLNYLLDKLRENHTTDITTYELSISNLKAEKEVLTQDCYALQNYLQRVHTENEFHKDLLTRTTFEKVVFEEECKKLSKEKITLEEKCKKLDEDKNELDEKCKKLEKEKTVLDEELSSFKYDEDVEARQEEYENKIEECENKIEELNEHIRHIHKVNDSYDDHNRKLINDLTHEKNSAVSQLIKKDEEMTQLRKEIGELKQARPLLNCAGYIPHGPNHPRYKTEMCKHYARGIKCPIPECTYAHGEDELRSLTYEDRIKSLAIVKQKVEDGVYEQNKKSATPFNESMHSLDQWTVVESKPKNGKQKTQPVTESLSYAEKTKKK